MQSSIEYISNAVWDQLAADRAERLPELIEERVTETLGDDADDTAIEEACRKVAAAMGPLAYN